MGAIVYNCKKKKTALNTVFFIFCILLCVLLCIWYLIGMVVFFYVHVTHTRDAYNERHVIVTHGIGRAHACGKYKTVVLHFVEYHRLKNSVPSGRITLT